MADNEHRGRIDRDRHDPPHGEQDVRRLGRHRDFGRDMLDDMRRYARGDYERGSGGGTVGGGTGGPEHGRTDGWRQDYARGHHRGLGPRGYKRSDERIREDVCDHLTDDPYVDATDIDIMVGNGEITLTGTIDSRAARRRAEDIAESVSGVAYVQNNLRVRVPGTPQAGGQTAHPVEEGTSGSTRTTGTIGRMDAPATWETIHTDSVTRR